MAGAPDSTSEKPRRELYPAVYAAIALVLMLALDKFWPVAELVPPPWNSRLAYILFAAGIVLVVSASILFRRRRTTVVPYETPQALVTSGPFRFSRNPIYLGFLVALAGVAVKLASLTPFLVLPLLWWALDRRVIPIEEEIMVEHFGEEWRGYAARVRRWI